MASSGSAAARDTPLIQAARTQDTQAVRILLRENVDVNATEADGATALLWAAQWNDRETADLLLRAGADVNIANQYGATPLWLACLNGSAQMTAALLSAGANPSLPLASGETPLMTASYTGNVEVVRALLEHGANVGTTESDHRQTALMWSLAEGHTDVARLLIDRGADIHARSRDGFTPLLFAVRAGDAEAVRLLLAYGASANETADDGSNALLVATHRGHVGVAKLLLDGDADPNADGRGYTPLHWAAGKWDSITTYDYVVESGEWSALNGVPAGKLELIEALLAHGANVNARTTKTPPRLGYSSSNQHGTAAMRAATPFFFAAAVGDTAVMRLLLANGADPSLTANDKTTALTVAAGRIRVPAESHVPEEDYLQAVKLCVALGMDVNAANKQGETPLHGAAYAGFDTVVQFLVDHGAYVNVRNAKGETPRGIATRFVFNMTNFSNPSTAALLAKLGGTLE